MGELSRHSAASGQSESGAGRARAAVARNVEHAAGLTPREVGACAGVSRVAP